jgi:hypothetical protein
MRRSAMVAGNPWTLLLLLEDDPDSLGCWLRVQELTLDGGTVDAWEQHYSRVSDALYDIEMTYGIGPGDWLNLD